MHAVGGALALKARLGRWQAANRRACVSASMLRHVLHWVQHAKYGCVRPAVVVSPDAANARAVNIGERFIMIIIIHVMIKNCSLNQM